jgi:hypothetical protein
LQENLDACKEGKDLIEDFNEEMEDNQILKLDFDSL